jgi:putative redox protein
MDVISILKKTTGGNCLRNEVHAERRGTSKGFYSYHSDLHFEGNQLDPVAVERAIELSTTKYCPAQAMLEKAVEIDHTYEIKNVDRE